MMKRKYIFGLIGTATFALIGMSCETVIDPDLQDAPQVLVVDAWINTNPGPQVIKLSQTQPYFDSRTPAGASGAVVTVVNETEDRSFSFVEDNSSKGTYRWVPAAPTELVGKTGDLFSLRITYGNDQFISAANLGRVPQVDSITFTFEEGSAFFPDSYQAEFWAKDPEGPGDTYWIKAYKNDTLLLKPGEINIAYDAGFTAGGNFDGVEFIPPIRFAINPFDTDENDVFLSPYDLGDSVYVEIHSISPAAFNFLNEVVIQIDRPGGFAELFASPLANVSTNISNINPNGRKAVGFFNVAAISGNGKRLVED